VTGEIKDLWADPITKPMFAASQKMKNTFGYNIYGLGGLTRTCLTVPVTCAARPASYGEFAGTQVNAPANFSSLKASAETILETTGEQFVRPPVLGVLNAGASGNAAGLSGIADDGGDALLNSGLTAASPDKAVREKLYVGGDAFVVYCDGHAKLRKNASLWSARYRSVDGKWKGGVPDGPAMNRGWSRDWPENRILSGGIPARPNYRASSATRNCSR